MAGQFFAVLAAAGLVSAGVAATGETRSAAALPTVSVEGVALAASAEADACKIEAVAPGADVVETLKQDRACYGAGQAGGEGAEVLPILLGAGAVVGLAIALGSSSNG